MKMEINEKEITFNIRYDMHQDDWKELADVLKLLPGFISVEKTGDFFRRGAFGFTVRLFMVSI